MAFNFDPKFEDWLDEKLRQIKSFSSQATWSLFRDREEEKEAQGQHLEALRPTPRELEDWDMDDVMSVTSEQDSRLPLNDSAQQGDYYQLMWNEGVDPTEGDPQGERKMSARERVARILRETELKSQKDPYAMTYIEEYRDEASYEDSAKDEYERRAATPTPTPTHSIDKSTDNLETRHDIMENGYIQFGKIPPSAKDEMFDSWDYDDELGLGEDAFHRGPADGQSDSTTRGSNPHSPKSPKSPKSPVGDELQIRFRKFKTDIDQIASGEYIMDEELGDVPYPLEMGQMAHDNPPINKEQAMLPMDAFDVGSSEDEAILDVSRDRNVMIDITDTQPIVTVDQAQLTEQWTKRKRKMMVAVMTLSVLIGVAAFVAIVYFVIHFLSE